MNDYQAIYKKAYSHPNYKMGDRRYHRFKRFFQEYFLPWMRGYCDVACGYGETLRWVRDQFTNSKIRGYELPGVAGASTWPEVVHEMPDITDIPAPDGVFSLVSCLDVLEHLEEDKAAPAIAELARISAHTLIVSVAWFSSRGPDHVEYHLNIKPFQWWCDLLSSVDGMSVIRAVPYPTEKVGWFVLERD